MNEVGRVPKESVYWIEQIASNLQHPSTIWIDSHSGDVHRACAQLDHEEHHDANGSEHAKGLHSKEIAGIE